MHLPPYPTPRMQQVFKNVTPWHGCCVHSGWTNAQPFGSAHGNWSFPGLTSEELAAEAQSLVDFIDEHGDGELGEAESVLQD